MLLARRAQQQRLVRDMQRLPTQIEHDHAQQQQRQRLRQAQQRPPRDQHQQQRAKTDPIGKTAVHPVPDPRRHQCTCHPGQAERTDGRSGPLQRRGRQRQESRRPEHVESGKQQQCQRTTLAQRSIPAQHAQHRAQQVAPLRRDRRHRYCGQALPQQRRQCRHHHRGQQVDHLPAKGRRHRTRHHARQQQADEHSALHHANHATALLGRCQRGGVGDQALGQRRAQQSGQQHARQQPARRARRRQPQQGQHQCDQLQPQQASPVTAVRQRQQAKQRQHAAGLAASTAPATARSSAKARAS